MIASPGPATRADASTGRGRGKRLCTPVAGSGGAGTVDGMDIEENDADTAGTSRDAERAEALAAYHSALRHPELRSDDELTRARALVAVADAKAAYAAAGGSPGSRYSEKFAHIYEEARALVAAAAQ